MNEEDTRNYVRRHLHDMRNHLNAVEMDALLLDSLLPEGQEAGEAVRRIRAEVTLIDGLLGGFAVRFGTLDLQWIAAADVFTQWRSRSGKAGSSPILNWRCEIGGESIRADMKVLASALCELLPAGSLRIATEASARIQDGGVLFQVRQDFGPGGAETGAAAPPPGFEDVIGRNGGRYRRELDLEAGQLRASCWFPCEDKRSGESPAVPLFASGS